MKTKFKIDKIKYKHFEKILMDYRMLPTLKNLKRWNKVNVIIQRKCPTILNTFWLQWNKKKFFQFKIFRK